jgi:hypothetical protein
MGFRPDLSAGPQYYTDGSVQSGQSFRAGRDGSLVVQESHGKWYEQLMRGNMFNAEVAVGGIALITTATTGNSPTLWNPTTPAGYNAEFARLTLSRLSGTDAPGPLGWYSTVPAGSAIATGGPIATFTNVAPPNALVGAPADAVMKWAPATCTFVAAPVFYHTAGIYLFTGTVAAVIAEISIQVDYDGMLGLGPNSALSLISGSATTTALYWVGLTYAVAKA